MPEYLAPGVYVEETSYRSKIIEGVSTTTTGFIGPARYGPVEEPTDLITSITEFERIYAGGDFLQFAAPGSFTDTTPSVKSVNYLWQAARAFFTEGGTRLYITRVFNPLSGLGKYPPNWSDPDYQATDTNSATPGEPLWDDGHGRVGEDQAADVQLRSRFPGAASNLIVYATIVAGQNILGAVPVLNPDGTVEEGGSPLETQYNPTFGSLHDGDVVVLLKEGKDAMTGQLYHVTYDPTVTDVLKRWQFVSLDGSPPGTTADWTGLDLNLNSAPGSGSSLRVLTATISVLSSDRAHNLGTWSGLALDPNHEIGGEKDSVTAQFDLTPGSLSDARSLPLVITAKEGATGLDIANVFMGDVLTGAITGTPFDGLSLNDALTQGISNELFLLGGNDGYRPQASDYEGTADEDQNYKTGLCQFEDIDEISIVAAPGYTADYNGIYRDQANAIMGLLIIHAEKMAYRIAVLDSPPGMSVGDIRKVRAKLDSSYAALYYPWVTVLDPITNAELNLPPSGFVAGIYARNDIQRAVWKAPANEVVNLALDFEQSINKAQQEMLNPEGINCFRFFEDRGFRLWGARTISSDSEWKYVNVRRYFAYLEHSIDKGTQWAVFEPNGDALWANVRRTISDFLLNEWQKGALLGDKPEKSFFVRCDRTTMTQNDLDNGRLICLIGVAPLYPAEFVIFRIGQWTSDASL